MTHSQEGLINWLKGYLDDKLTSEQVERIEKEVQHRLRNEREKNALDDLFKDKKPSHTFPFGIDTQSIGVDFRYRPNAF